MTSFSDAASSRDMFGIAGGRRCELERRRGDLRWYTRIEAAREMPKKPRSLVTVLRSKKRLKLTFPLSIPIFLFNYSVEIYRTSLRFYKTHQTSTLFGRLAFPGKAVFSEVYPTMLQSKIFRPTDRVKLAMHRAEANFTC